MEKATLKSVIGNLETDQVITINFHSTVPHPSGEYRVESKRKGRGKGGSMLAEVSMVTDDPNSEPITIGTPRNNDVVNVVIDGVMHGYETEEAVPALHETNETKATMFKGQFKKLLAKDVEFPVVATVVSTVPELNGTFNVTGARQLRGRGGQVVLTTEQGTELWSYRHSGIIQEFSLNMPEDSQEDVGDVVSEPTEDVVTSFDDLNTED